MKDYCAVLQKYLDVSVVAPAANVDDREVEVRSFWAPPGRALSTLSLCSFCDVLMLMRVMLSGFWATLKTLFQYRKTRVHVLALWVLPCGFWARLATLICGGRYSTWALGSDIWCYQNSRLFRPLLRACIRHGQHSFADGFQLCAEVKAIAGQDCAFLPSSRRLPTVPNQPNRNKGKQLLHFLGRWHPNKGVDLLLSALELLDESDWRQIDQVVIAGGGPLEAEVNSRVHSLQQAGRPVSTSGYLGARQATDFIAKADYLLLPSRIESIPVILSDAVHCRTPLVMTPVGDLPNLFAQYHFGVIADSTDIVDLAAALKQAVRQPADECLGDCVGLQNLLSLERSAEALLKTLGLMDG